MPDHRAEKHRRKQRQRTLVRQRPGLAPASAAEQGLSGRGPDVERLGSGASSRSRPDSAAEAGGGGAFDDTVHGAALGLARDSAGGASVASASSGGGSAAGAPLLRLGGHARQPSRLGRSASAAGTVGSSQSGDEGEAHDGRRKPWSKRAKRWLMRYLAKPVFG